MEYHGLLKKEKRDSPLSVRLPRSVIDKIKEISSKTHFSQSEIIEISIKSLENKVISEMQIPTLKYFQREYLKYIDISKNKFFNTPLEENKVISLFSGAGGLDIGLEQAGFNTVVCVEIDANCRETLRFNRPKWTLIESDDNGTRTPGDIRDISVEEILRTGGLKKGEAALVVGGAPCQPFSNIGKKLGKTCPQNGDLFLEFVRVVKGALPKAFIFENVSGIAQTKHKQVIEYMKDQFKGLGYSLSASILNAANYSVPQKRDRFILMGIKSNTEPAFPLPSSFKDKSHKEKFIAGFAGDKPAINFKKWTSLKNTFSNLPKKYQERDDYSVMNISSEVKRRMEYIGTNENFKALPANLRPNCWKSGKHQGVDTFGRLDINQPSVTIRTAAYNPSKGKYIHPLEHRGLNTIELAAIQTFPHNWHFKAKGRKKITLVSGGMQIGNAVPPLLAKALGESIKKQILYILN